MSNQAPVSTLIDKLLAAKILTSGQVQAIASVPYNGLGQQQVKRFYLNSDGAMRQEERVVMPACIYTPKPNRKAKNPAVPVLSGQSKLEKFEYRWLRRGSRLPKLLAIWTINRLPRVNIWWFLPEPPFESNREHFLICLMPKMSLINRVFLLLNLWEHKSPLLP
jgi:hypothetical protein